MFIATISAVNGTTIDANSVKQVLTTQLDWSSLVRAFVSQYEWLTENLVIEIKERAHYEPDYEPDTKPVVVIVGDTATHLLQNIVRWVSDTQYHVLGNNEVSINGLRVAFRYGKYERQEIDPYQAGRFVTGVYLDGGLGVKEHNLTCIARGYINLGTYKCDGEFVTAYSASSYFPAEDADKWGLPTSIFA